MYSPDLIQRIYYDQVKGNNTGFEKVFKDLRSHDFEFISKFEFKDKKINWTCFESRKYIDIIKEADHYVYFYLWDTFSEFEIIIPGHTYPDDLSKMIQDRTPFFHSIWVIGKYFPGLDTVTDRPVKINLHNIRRDISPIQKLDFWFKKMLTQYSRLKKPIFQRVDYPKYEQGEKPWKKIVPKQK